jgi:ribosome-associated heat shock protein Hsp15
VKPSVEPSGIDRQRIDKWLWHARLVRTRTAAQELVVAGDIRVNRVKIDSSSRAVKLGDVLTVPVASVIRVLRVTGFSERRGSAADARRLFDDLAPPAPRRKDTAPASPAPAERPDKHDRADLMRLKREGTLDDEESG